MIYSRLYLQKKTNIIPLIIFTCLSLSLLLGTFFFRPNSVKTEISKEKVVRQEVVNMSSEQVGIFWETEFPQSSWLIFSEGNSTSFIRVNDERAVTGSVTKFTYHYALLKNLKPETAYSYKIIGGNGLYAQGQKTVFGFKTPKKTPYAYNLKPAYGKIVGPNGKPAANTVILYKIENKMPLLALSKSTGEWLIPLNNIINQNQNSGQTSTLTVDTAKVTIEFLDEKGKNSYISTIVQNTNPLSQTVVLGKNYSFLARGDVLSAQTDSLLENKNIITVTYPRENALIPAGKPLIKGTGIPNNEVLVFINSSPQYSFRTIVDERGDWRVLPTQTIGAGSYTALITSRDARGGKISIKRNFIIAKSGEQVLGTATGEPTIAPSPTVFYRNPTVTPVTVVPTIIAFLPSPTTVRMPTPLYPSVIPTQGPPQSGGNINNLMYMSVFMIIAGVGLLLVF